MALLDKPIALDPGVGGVCIDGSALQPADIIVSTTKAGLSLGIRMGTRSAVSHAALYVGNLEVIEAIGAGVVRRSLDAALADDVLAVAYRSPDMKPGIAQKILKYAADQRDARASYSIRGAVLSTDKILCRIISPRPATFFCSQLVFEAYKQGGLPLTSMPSQCVTPQVAVEVAIQRLVYVGHLLGNTAWFPTLSP